MELSSKMIKKAFLLVLGIVFTVVVAVSIFLAITFRMEPEVINIGIQNQSNMILQIYEESLLRGKVLPSEMLKFETVKGGGLYFVAKDMNGEKIFETSFTRDELRGKKEYLIVIPPGVKPLEPSNNATPNRQASQAATPSSFGATADVKLLWDVLGFSKSPQNSFLAATSMTSIT